MSFNILNPQIKNLLATLTDIQEISETPKIKFSGYPAACIYPSDNSSDYETTTENIRVYAFYVVLFYETKESGVDYAIKAMRGLVDSVIDKFDQEDYKDSTARTIGLGLPSGYTYLNIFANPARWGEMPNEDLVTAEILVKIRISRDIT
jgi:hypothetical protein